MRHRQETLELLSDSDREALKASGARDVLKAGHLKQSLRYYRNTTIEERVAAVLNGDAEAARQVAKSFDEPDTVWLTRSLQDGKSWIRNHRVGEQRGGIVGAGNGGRLAAEGLFVGRKSNIADWMLKPDGNIRSSNMLETIQNQYQIQGLEIDWALVCWDLDLRRSKNGWAAHKLSGTKWQAKAASLDVAKNGYRALLTRARKGMAIYVPIGDPTGVDETRSVVAYRGIAKFLLQCGARSMETPAR